MTFLVKYSELIERTIPVVICVLMVAVVLIAINLFNDEMEDDHE